jgi:hypothetical protein
LSTSLATEIGRALGAESTITASLNTEISRAGQAEQDISGALRTLISDETTRATGVEATLSTSLATEIGRATTAESGLSTSIGTEISRAGQAETDISGALRTLIANETTRAINAETDISGRLATEVGRALGAESTITASLNAEISRAIAKEQDISGALRTLITAEQTRAITRETDISGRLATEVSRATTAEAGILSTAAATYIVASGYTGQSSITTVGTIATGVWQASTIASAYGGTGFSTYAKGDLLVADASGRLAKITVGTSGQVLRSVGGTAAWSANDTSGVSLTDSTNFGSSTNVQQALDYLFEFTKTRKIISHAVTSSIDYSGATVPNPNFALGSVQFIGYDASYTTIYFPPVGTGYSYADGTVYRIVHNGEPGDANFVVKYRNVDTSTDVAVLELAPRDSISLIWDADTGSYLYAVGI